MIDFGAVPRQHVFAYGSWSAWHRELTKGSDCSRPKPRPLIGAELSPLGNGCPGCLPLGIDRDFPSLFSNLIGFLLDLESLFHLPALRQVRCIA